MLHAGDSKRTVCDPFTVVYTYFMLPRTRVRLKEFFNFFLNGISAIQNTKKKLDPFKSDKNNSVFEKKKFGQPYQPRRRIFEEKRPTGTQGAKCRNLQWCGHTL